MIDLEFRSQSRPLKTVTRAVGHAIGDSVLYHTLQAENPQTILVNARPGLPTARWGLSAAICAGAAL